MFQEWLDHPHPDEYWDAYNPTAEEYAHTRIPVLTITGSYDDDQPGAIEHYRNHLRHGGPQSRENHYLVIGPWDHARTGAPVAEFGGLKFGPDSLIDMHQLHLAWYAWTMQDGPKPELLKKRVAYYVMGAERWRHADTLTEVTASHEPYALGSHSNANDVLSSGFLGERSSGAPDRYTYDPRWTQGPEVEAEARTSGGSLVDAQVMHALHGRLLVYHSAPFATATEISGFFRLTAWIAIDCPDTDLYASVYEIGLDGSTIRLSTDGLRARYREGPRIAKLIDTRSPLRYDFERFTFVSRQIARGHRLRLVIAPVGRLVETTFAEKNYNGGGAVSAESVADSRPVTVTLFHDESHPSILYVPLGKPDERDDAE